MTFAQLTALAVDTVTATQRSLPPELRSLALAVPVHYEALPDDDVIADGFPDDILGLFTGDAHGTELAHDQPSPPQIILYIDNLWDYAEGDRAIFRDEARLTYLHELGHYFGWDEDELTARGLD
jgi:predicted Zn-dependent protease with MMP-like domain